MNALILAAGFGSRLKPWTDYHPKALVPVGGMPMLERVIRRLEEQGFERIIINVHHFADQIKEYIRTNKYEAQIIVSDESGCLLDTGGGIVKASGLIDFSSGPLLVHNVDILGNADLRGLVRRHIEGRNDATLLLSNRSSSRKLIFDEDMNLKGWHSLKENRFKPQGIEMTDDDKEYAFSGIHVVSENAVKEMIELKGSGSFPIMDYYLSPLRKEKIRGYVQNDLKLIDIGKPESLEAARILYGESDQ